MRLSTQTRLDVKGCAEQTHRRREQSREAYTVAKEFTEAREGTSTGELDKSGRCEGGTYVPIGLVFTVLAPATCRLQQFASRQRSVGLQSRFRCGKPVATRDQRVPDEPRSIGSSAKMAQRCDRGEAA